MAYFANGTEGDTLNEQCHKCLHGMSDSVLCPVAAVQMEYNYKQLDDGNEDLHAAMNLLVNEAGECQMKAAMEKAGTTLDLSGKDQLPLFQNCSCRKSDSWRCAKDQTLPNALHCTFSCHRSHP